MLISIEAHITCDFPAGGGGEEGSGSPIPPLDRHMKSLSLLSLFYKKENKQGRTQEFVGIKVWGSL